MQRDQCLITSASVEVRQVQSMVLEIMSLHSSLSRSSRLGWEVRGSLRVGDMVPETVFSLARRRSWRIKALALKTPAVDFE